MPLTNIIDGRNQHYRFNTVLAIVEPTHHDNSCAGADQSEAGPASDRFIYAERCGISVSNAVRWADGFESQVTLYLYDRGGGGNESVGLDLDNGPTEREFRRSCDAA
jgi:hypothetical protein